MSIEAGRSALVHCNAGRQHGMGHLMRALTLSAEAVGRGWSVTFAGDFDDTARRVIAESRIDLEHVYAVELADQHEVLPRLADRALPDLIHIDSYLPESSALVGTAPLLSSIQDGGFGVRKADLTIDPNLDAEAASGAADWGRSHVAGIEYALIRSQVRAQRGRWSPSSARSRVLVVLGGTDPFAFTPRLMEAVSARSRDLDITVVAPPAVRSEVQRIATPSSCHVTVTGFLSDLPAAAVTHDLVVSAAGTSVWDLACMGVPTAMVCVTENQERGYDAAVAHGLAVGVQRFPHASWEDAADLIVDLLRDESALRALSAAGMGSVDGLGAWRVVGAWESLLQAQPSNREQVALTHRVATMGDARMLFEWRNDPATRRMSRSTDVLVWADHLAWLQSVLSDDSRRLLVVERDQHAVGTVRWDRKSGVDWEASITVAPANRGEGLSSSVLAAGERGIQSDRPRRLIAGINESNTPSRHLFSRAGYLPFMPADRRGFAEYAKMLPPVA